MTAYTIKLILVVFLAVLCFGILLWFWYLQRRAEKTEASTVNQLYHVLSDEEIYRKIHRLDKALSSPD